MYNKLIILRGPAGSGKGTIARALQKLGRSDTLIIDQDYYRHALLAGKDDEKGIVPEMIRQNALTALAAGYNVIIEGIFRKRKYLPMFQALIDTFRGETHVYYFDIGFDETARRHAMRDKSALFSTEEMKAWYGMAAPLGIAQEHRISERMAEEEVIKLVQEQAKL